MGLFWTIVATIGIALGLTAYVLFLTAGVVFIVIAVDGMRYGGPRFRDWRAPVFTFGGVALFLAIFVGLPFWFIGG